MQTAPLHNEIAEGPAEGRALWLTTEDGLRIRIAVWAPGSAAGTVLLFPGRTEYAEKYGRAAADLAARGFATVAIDWRGQGLADRLHHDPALGHVDRFAAYQRDVDAVARAVGDLGLPRPLYLLAHSMGGAIGLRALYRGLDVAAAAFTAPMWGIRFSPLMRPAAWVISAASRPLGLGGRMTPGKGGESYVLSCGFEDNELTCDAEMFAYMRRQLVARPEMAVSGPSLGWLHEALRETRSLGRRPAPGVSALTFLGGDERIVCPEAIRARMEFWPGGRLSRIDRARHEVMMEGPEIRARVFDQVAEHFSGQANHTRTLMHTG